MVHWLALCFRNLQVNPLAGSTSAEDNQGYELFGEIALINQRFVVVVISSKFLDNVVCVRVGLI